MSTNLYEVSYPSDMWGDHPAYSVQVTAKSPGAAKYDQWLEASDCCDITFIDFCKEVRVKKVSQSVPLPRSAPFDRPERIAVVNQLIREIGSRSHRSLYYEKLDRYATFHWANGYLWYRDDYTGEPIVMIPDQEGKTREQKRGFSHGGTMWGLIQDFRDYIFGDDDANHNNGYGGLFCKHWGYPSEDMEAIRAVAVELGYLKMREVKAT